jgi:hypothetical protein
MWRMNRIALCLGVALAGVLVTGCKHGPATTLKIVPFELPPGYTKVENPEQGLAIGAPPGWGIGAVSTMDVGGLAGMDPSSMGGGDFAAKMEKANEEQAKADVKALEAKGIYLSIIDKGARPVVGEERTRCQIYKQDMGGNAQLEDATKKIQDDLINEDAPQMIDLPIGKAVKIHAHNVNRDGGNVDKYYYGLVNGQNMYIVRFVTEQASNDLDNISMIAMKSLRISK